MIFFIPYELRQDQETQIHTVLNNNHDNVTNVPIGVVEMS